MWLAKTNSPAGTRSLGSELSRFIAPGEVIALIGDLGAGKTTLVQGFAEGLGIPENVYVNSPTFTIVNEYPTIPPIYHFDFYRLGGEEELYETGYLDAIRSDGVCLVEWFDNIPGAGPDELLRIEIEGKGNEQNFAFLPVGETWAGRLEDWEAISRVK